ncbi:DUF4917 family protein [uncultured Tateyamaria sp.]|uniref:DUF4917 family protein n=1 Tax=uncultured Tateyamaria sp. TaxID=455651 RepID=UPI0026099950|nr:DUF4917 family protein [uncultured Tateyamaria sp.]
MSRLLTFEEALDASEGHPRHLLLGNGFSIACKPKIFTYGSLYSKADFSQNPKLPEVFKKLETQDFELVINALERSSRLIPIYDEDSITASQEMQADAKALKKILISTVTKNHPDGPFDISEEEYFACRQFLANFIGTDKGKVFTLNYDLLLYWTVMHTEFSDGDYVELIARDGFGDDDPDVKEDYVVWQSEAGSRARASIYYLHGALHLFDDGSQLKKFTWVRTDKRLKDQSWQAIEQGALPLFVAEGTSESKKNKIMHSGYLHQAYRAFKSAVTQTRASFFVHGHSLAESDDHFLRLLGAGKYPRLFVGLHGDPSSSSNQAIVKKARAIADMRNRPPLEVAFYDTGTAAVWG